MSIVDPTMPGTSTNIWHLSRNTINLHWFTQESKPSHTMEMETMAAHMMVDHAESPHGYVTPAASGIPSALERGAKSEVAHLWARWLRNPCCLRDPLRFKAGDKSISGPLVGKVGAQSKVAHLWARWLRNPAASGIPFASKREAKSEVAHLWARWLRNPCRLGDPLRFRAGGKIRSGALVRKLAT